MTEPEVGSLALRLLAVVLLVAANAFFVAAEFALVAARRTRIEALARDGDRKAKTVLKALQDLYRQLSAAQLGITVASIMLGFVAEDTVAELFRGWFAALPPALSFLTRAGVTSTVALTIISFLHVVVGEQLPKSWAITHPERTSLLDRSPVDPVLVGHAAVHEPAGLELAPRRAPDRSHRDHVGARAHSFTGGDPHAG